ncbi:hypothetical protein [Aquamicrobium sp. LC103]|uniref:hypothetical protein n=1 Tax=Aquamicrobium sp. LC103 TaxID=1120658 RepID=UPI0032B2F437
MNARRFYAAAPVAALMALAGCQATDVPPMSGGGPVAAAPRPSPVDGEWAGSDGASYSRFSGGIFQTLANDTGNTLAEGRFVMRDQNTVQITGTSMIRQQPISFNCLMVSPTQLNCTSSGGQQFSLMRRTGVS